MNTKLGRLCLLLVSASLILSGLTYPASAKAQATVTIIRFEESEPFSFFNECTGEVVSGIVNLKGQVTITEDGRGGFHFRVHERFFGRAEGETSGTQYVGPQTDHESFHVGSSLTDTFTLNFRFISRGGGDNIQLHVLEHITITADGQVSSVINIVREECRG